MRVNSLKKKGWEAGIAQVTKHRHSDGFSGYYFL